LAENQGPPHIIGRFPLQSRGQRENWETPVIYYASSSKRQSLSILASLLYLLNSIPSLGVHDVVHNAAFTP
jgi:hypothetical protein